MSGYPAYRAPHADRSRLCVPELGQIEGLIAENQNIFSKATCSWMDVSLSTVRQWAREETLNRACDYTQSYLAKGSHASSQLRDLHSNVDLTKVPLILSGHQPELFHPGVWFKNFLLSSIARQYSGVGLNVLIDHDLARTFSMKVPKVGPDGILHDEALSIDEGNQGRPWEYAVATDITRWQEFLPAVVDRVQSVGIHEPLLCELWPSVLNSLAQGKPIGEAFSAARHTVERLNGLQTIELPLSRLASERSFACFVGEFLSRIESVHESFHAARNAYRLHHRIKNQVQPIPELGRDGDWFESPFWVYSATEPNRRPLWVCRDAMRLRLSDRRAWQTEFPGEGNFESWFCEWRKLEAASVFIRPRALTTTTYLRLAVGDLFIHGIGGGKYDQMTDQMMQLLWSIDIPHYVVATATLHLPMPSFRSHVSGHGDHSETEVQERIRRWRFSPDRLIDTANQNGTLDALLEKRRMLLSNIPMRAKKSSWHLELQQLNTRIRNQLPESDDSLAEQLRQAQNRGREQKILTSREHSIALFQNEWIVDHLRQLCDFGTPERSFEL